MRCVEYIRRQWSVHHAATELNPGIQGALPLSTTERIDRVGAWLSLSCAAHCMVAPLFLIVFPLAGLGRFVNHPIEGGLLVVSVGLAVGSLCWGFHIHRRGRVLFVLGSALAMIATGRFWAEESHETILVTAGAVTLAAGHLLNRHLCKACVPCQHGETDAESHRAQQAVAHHRSTPPHRASFLGLLSLVVSLGFAPAAASAAPIPVVATLPVLADFVRALGGEHVRVRSLITGLESEHTYTPKPSDLEAVHQAVMLVKVGLGLEVWVNGMIDNADNPSLLVVETSRGMDIIRGGDSPAHDGEGHRDVSEDTEAHTEGNPHVWLDPDNAKIMVRHISEGLIRVDPARRTIYLANQVAYLKQLDDLQRSIAEGFASVSNRKIITHHPAWPYFARRFGLDIRGDIYTQIGSEPSAKRIAGLVRTVNAEHIKVIISEPQLSPKIPNAIAQETGVKVVVLTPLPGALPDTEDYLSMMRYNARTLIEALR